MKYFDRNGAVIEGEAKFVKSWVDMDRENLVNEKKWILWLRNHGIKASHPDDGWVNREKNEVHFCYPQFNDGADVGDLVALGWDFDESFRLVKLISSRKTMFDMKYFGFKYIKTVYKNKKWFEFFKTTNPQKEQR